VERSATELTGRLAEYARRAEQVKAMQDGVDDLRGTGYSDDGLVTAVVGGRGELLELELDPRIYREPNAVELAARIVAAVHEAAAQAEEAAAGLAAKLLPRNRRDAVDPRFDLALHVIGEASALEDRND
jgi:DNA-binding protein YbaB